MAGLLGIPCPGCGLTRASLLALTGDFSGALRLHPLVFVMGPLVGWFTARAAFNYFRGPRPSSAPARAVRTERHITIAASVLLVAMLSVWIARFAGYFGGPAPVQKIDFGNQSSFLSLTRR